METAIQDIGGSILAIVLVFLLGILLILWLIFPIYIYMINSKLRETNYTLNLILEEITKIKTDQLNIALDNKKSRPQSTWNK